MERDSHILPPQGTTLGQRSSACIASFLLPSVETNGQQVPVRSTPSRSSAPNACFKPPMSSDACEASVGPHPKAAVSTERCFQLLPLRHAILLSGPHTTPANGFGYGGDYGDSSVGEDDECVGTLDTSSDGGGVGGNLVGAAMRRRASFSVAAATSLGGAADGSDDGVVPERACGLAVAVAVAPTSRALLHLQDSTVLVDMASRPVAATNSPLSGHTSSRDDDSVRPPEGVGACADFWQQLRQQQKVLREIARLKWWILAVPLLLCFLLCGLGVFGVVYASELYSKQLRDYARGALASTAINTVAGQLEIATFAVMTLSAYLTQRPNCSELNGNYNKLAEVIFQWDAKQAVYQLQAMPAAVVQYIHPYPDPPLAAVLFGRDILKLAQYRNDTLQQIRAREQRLLLGPYNLVEGFKAMFVTYAVFLPAPDPLYDWGCGVQPYECPPDTCWVTDNKTGEHLKLWGMATSLVRLDALKEGFGFQQYEQQGYRYRLWQQADEINRFAVIDGTEQLPHDPVALTFSKYNLQWVFEVSPAGGWVPAWRNPCIVAVVLGSVVVSCLVLWLLLTREKHNLLLRAMLPRKVIRQLQRGEQTVVEEYLEPVTILFTDIVSYTEVASQLTPLQVVRLLNDLYTEFDALTDKHGVYKVETIGDAFMCVSGCPLKEDPVRAAVRMAGMAQDMLVLVGRFVARVAGEEMKVKIRIGLHSGPVVAGVIGQRMPRYCLFGDTVNTASRMESNSAPMAINISSETAELLRAAGAVVVPYSGGGRNGLTPPPPPRQQQQRQLAERPSRRPSGLAEALLAPSPLPPLPPQLAPSPLPLALPSSPLLRVLRQQQSLVDRPPSILESQPSPLLPPLPPQQELQHHHQRRLQQQLAQVSQQQCEQQQHQHGARQGSFAAVKSDAERAGGLACVAASVPEAGGGCGGGPLVLHSRGVIHIKGKGPMLCYWLGRPPPCDDVGV